MTSRISVESRIGTIGGMCWVFVGGEWEGCRNCSWAGSRICAQNCERVRKGVAMVETEAIQEYTMPCKGV